MEIKERLDSLVNWLIDKVEQAHAKGVVFGLSGGIDSAVVAGAARKAFGENALGIIMPCHSNEEDEKHARLVANTIDLTIEKVDLTETFDTLLRASMVSGNQMAVSNIKPRLRMTTLYYYAQHHNYLVLSGSNLSEFYTGYFTKYGDSGADLMPIANFLKSEVYDLARELGIPDEIINKKPSAGLWPGQTDEQEMGFSYDVLDRFIQSGNASERDAKKISNMHTNSAHKRSFPPIFDAGNAK